MKWTFVRTMRDPWAVCHECGEMPTVPWWWNWRKQATVKVLCAQCYTERAEVASERIYQEMSATDANPPVEALK